MSTIRNSDYSRRHRKIIKTKKELEETHTNKKQLLYYPLNKLHTLNSQSIGKNSVKLKQQKIVLMFLAIIRQIHSVLSPSTNNFYSLLDKVNSSLNLRDKTKNMKKRLEPSPKLW